MVGSPPHARGRLNRYRRWRRDRGITPACAGKTWAHSAMIIFLSDHPRMRGEDCGGRLAGTVVRGSPPHARGRPSKISAISTRSGITPACAGKTASEAASLHGWLDHPRMRGEDQTFVDSMRTQGDHPRMRGEDDATRKIRMQGNGSPPHARGRPELDKGALREMRITPACAGKTLAAVGGGDGCGDHPRMRGEDGQIDDHIGELCGSPPHARGRHGFRSLCS